jgi:hypothetical protein
MQRCAAGGSSGIGQSQSQQGSARVVHSRWTTSKGCDGAGAGGERGELGGLSEGGGGGGGGGEGEICTNMLLVAAVVELAAIRGLVEEEEVHRERGQDPIQEASLHRPQVLMEGWHHRGNGRDSLYLIN